MTVLKRRRALVRNWSWGSGRLGVAQGLQPQAQEKHYRVATAVSRFLVAFFLMLLVSLVKMGNKDMLEAQKRGN